MLGTSANGLADKHPLSCDPFQPALDNHPRTGCDYPGVSAALRAKRACLACAAHDLQSRSHGGTLASACL